MPLNCGERLGPYEILQPIGAGGMGEVYKARDTRLGRTVAIKIAAVDFGERFRREALAIAALNHPNICTLYDVGPDYLVMEFIEGSQLRGTRPVAEALVLAIQIAEAVCHAHKHGVIHRDLKPGNILVSKSGVKVLDFGLARLSRADAAHGVPGSVADVTVTLDELTQPGAILGTPRYMAPEQLEGKEADQRSDIFAFGLVLYELLTGKPAFQGDSQANLVAAVLTAQPTPLIHFQPLTPPALVHLVDTCLAKDPGDRRQTMHDVLLELRWIAGGGSQAGLPQHVTQRRKRREGLAWVLAAVGLSAACVVGLVQFREEATSIDPIRFEQTLPPRGNNMNWWDPPAMSPDGRSVAFTAVASNSHAMLWLRPLDSVQARLLPGTEDASQPFWSPDSRYVAYFAAGKLWKIDASGGPPQILCDAPQPFGGAWNREGLIVFGKSGAPLQRVSSGGGQPESLIQFDAARAEQTQGCPHFLPDGRHFLYCSYSGGAESGTYIGSLESKDPRRLLDFASNATFSSPGLLLFGRGPVLMAQTFDPKALRLAGEPFPVVDVLVRAPNSLGINLHSYSSSPGGALVYRTESPTAANRQLTWRNRSGQPVGLVGEPRAYIQGSLSPDEKRFAVQVAPLADGPPAIWVMVLSSGIISRLTTDPAIKNTPQWSPDGQEILFTSSKDGIANLHRMSIGGGEERIVSTINKPVYPAKWMPDGSIVFQNTHGRSFFRLPPGAGANVETLFQTEYAKDALRVSPDGRWAAFSTTESGRWEVYIAAFPSFTRKRQVSNNGGSQGYWRKDGKELFYLSLDGKVVSVPIKPGSVLEAGSPTILFPTRISVDPKTDQFAATGDGQRFLLLEAVDPGVNSLTVVLNWSAGPKNRSATR